MTHNVTRLLVSEGEAAELLATSIRTLQAWRGRGGGPLFVRVGHGRGKIRYRIVDIEEYIAGRLRKSTSDRGGAS